MILLDTNVVSELMRVPRHHAVELWYDRQTVESLALSTVSVAEILYGIGRLPRGRRRIGVADSFDALLGGYFSGRVWPFDQEAARAYGTLASKRRAEGFNTGDVELMIAAIALSREAVVATRNVRDFEGCGVVVINPWEAG